MKPTPVDIEQVILELIRSSRPGYMPIEDPDESYTPLWWVYAYDPQGNARGIGTDSTLRGALAAAWIFSQPEIDENLDDFWSRPLDARDFNCVPREVPDDWAFEIDNMPTDGRS
jgi:hypothetical protein